MIILVAKLRQDKVRRNADSAGKRGLLNLKRRNSKNFKVNRCTGK